MISVVVPTLGTRSDYLWEALESIKGQTRLPSEVIIINNGSEEFINIPKVDEIKIIQYRIPFRAGVAQARNFGVSVSKSNYVSFLDDDDLWDRQYLERVMDILQETPDIVLGRIDKLHNGISEPFMDATKYISKKSFLLFNPGATGSNTTVNKRAFLELGGYDPRLPPAEDGALILEAISNNLIVMVENKAISYMRMHEGERLTDPRYAIAGYKAFYGKYQSQMNFRERSFNSWRVGRELKNLKPSLRNYFKFMFLSALIIVLRMTPKDIWAPIDTSENN